MGWYFQETRSALSVDSASFVKVDVLTGRWSQIAVRLGIPMLRREAMEPPKAVKDEPNR